MGPRRSQDERRAKAIVQVAPPEAQVITTGFIPRPIQAQLYRKVMRFNVLVCHRRFGKSMWEINRQIDAGLRLDRSHPRYGYFAPFRDQAKRIAWDYMKRFTEAIPGREVNEAELRVDIPRPWLGDYTRLQIFGTDNMPALKGVYFDGAGLDEFAEMNPSAWTEAIRPTLSDRKGWADILGTPKGRNKFCELYEYAMHAGDPEWFGALYKASETGIIDADELASLKRQMPEEEYEQEYECSFTAALVGAYFAREMARAEREGRIKEVLFDPALPVDTYWDLGISDATSIWFVQSTRGLHQVIDYLEMSEVGLPEIVGQLKELGYFPKKIGRTVLPHDALARDLSTGKTRVQMLYDLGVTNIDVVPRVGAKMESINAARVALAKCVFDRKRCDRGIQALLNYKKKWNEKLQVFGDSPEHNWASHGADAFQCFAMGSRDDSRAGSFLSANGFDGSRPLEAEMDYDVYA